MSGGVDSSVAAALLIEQGYEVIGVTIKTYKYEDVGGNVGNDSSCCSLDGINDARRVAMALDMPHYVVDFTEPFKHNVIDYFVDSYLSGETPNPCVMCNRHIKWNQLLLKADALGAEYIAMGHYTRLRQDEQSGRYIISRGKDVRKDQSYMLWNVTQEALSRTLFPLADFTKEEARAIAEKHNLPIAAKGESYEICFIPDDDYRRFLRDNAPEKIKELDGGDIVLDGEVIGKHNGFPMYTIGQRRGLGVSHNEPLYVLNVLSDTNTVEVGSSEGLRHGGLIARAINMIKYSELEKPLEVIAKIRYKDKGEKALCTLNDDGTFRLDFETERRAIAPGQSVVLYEGDDVVGGGVIESWV
jgi:tRNA-specific 2-thiouridylase